MALARACILSMGMRVGQRADTVAAVIVVSNFQACGE